MRNADSGLSPRFAGRSPIPFVLISLTLFAVSFSTTLGFGQGATGAINGTLSDASGAVIPGAKVVLRNVATGVETTTASNDVGLYVFPSLAPGRYTLAFSKEGFATVQQAEFSLAVNQTLTYDVTVPVAGTTKVVEVTAPVAQVETSTAELGTAIQETQVDNLPLNGRNFTQLLELTPGVSPISTGQNSGVGVDLRETPLAVSLSLPSTDRRIAATCGYWMGSLTTPSSATTASSLSWTRSKNSKSNPTMMTARTARPWVEL